MHTTMGDIHMKLYPEECPKSVENFTTHCKNGYYDNLIFHRVIKGFMIQTGDPLGDGTGGQSIWGREFEDEFHKRQSILSANILSYYALELSSWFQTLRVTIMIFCVWSSMKLTPSNFSLAV